MADVGFRPNAFVTAVPTAQGHSAFNNPLLGDKVHGLLNYTRGPHEPGAPSAAVAAAAASRAVPIGVEHRPRTPRRGAAIAVVETTITPRGAPEAEPEVNNLARSQPHQSRRHPCCLFLLYLAVMGAFALAVAAYYLSHGRSTWYDHMPALLLPSSSTVSRATSELSASTVAWTNGTMTLEDAERKSSSYTPSSAATGSARKLTKGSAVTRPAGTKQRRPSKHQSPGGREVARLNGSRLSEEETARRTGRRSRRQREQ